MVSARWGQEQVRSVFALQTLSSVLSCCDVEEELLTVVVVQSTASNTGSR